MARGPQQLRGTRLGWTLAQSVMEIPLPCLSNGDAYLRLSDCQQLLVTLPNTLSPFALPTTHFTEGKQCDQGRPACEWPRRDLHHICWTLEPALCDCHALPPHKTQQAAEPQSSLWSRRSDPPWWLLQAMQEAAPHLAYGINVKGQQGASRPEAGEHLLRPLARNPGGGVRMWTCIGGSRASPRA